MREVNTDDLFIQDEDTPGGLEDELGPSRMVVLKNFALNGSAIKQTHVEALRDQVVPFLERSAVFADLIRFCRQHVQQPS